MRSFYSSSSKNCRRLVMHITSVGTHSLLCFSMGTLDFLLPMSAKNNSCNFVVLNNFCMYQQFSPCLWSMWITQYLKGSLARGCFKISWICKTSTSFNIKILREVIDGKPYQIYSTLKIVLWIMLQSSLDFPCDYSPFLQVVCCSRKLDFYVYRSLHLLSLCL